MESTKLRQLLNIWLFKPFFDAYLINRNYRRMRDRFPNCEISQECAISPESNLESGVKLTGNVTLEGNVRVGRGTLINGPTRLHANSEAGIEIGNFCSIASDVLFRVDNHPINYPSTSTCQDPQYKSVFEKAKSDYASIIVKNDVWVGAKAIILGGVEIGNGAIIGAGAVVTKYVPDFTIVGGVPARHLRDRFPEKIKRKLSEMAWWNWPDDVLRKNVDFFSTEFNCHTRDGACFLDRKEE